MEGQPSPTMERTHLCPRCTNPLIKEQYTCPSCSLEFKDKVQTRRISIIYPGGGYFYTGHPFLGIGDALTEIYLTFLVIISLIGSLSGAVRGFAPVVIIGIILVLEKVMTVYHSNHFIKEYIPKDRSVEIITTIPQGQSPAEIIPESTPEEVLSAGWRSS